ncbi:hypothetical protein K0M31_012977, partial [Melipona bicolor]
VLRWRLCATRKYTGTVGLVFQRSTGPRYCVSRRSPRLDLARENNSLRPPLRKLNVANHAVRITNTQRRQGPQARGPPALSKLEDA